MRSLAAVDPWDLRYLRHVPSGDVSELDLVQYYERELKIKFMEKHGIDISIVRLVFMLVIAGRGASLNFPFTQLGQPMARLPACFRRVPTGE